MFDREHRGLVAQHALDPLAPVIELAAAEERAAHAAGDQVVAADQLRIDLLAAREDMPRDGVFFIPFKSYGENRAVRGGRCVKEECVLFLPATRSEERLADLY